MQVLKKDLPMLAGLVVKIKTTALSLDELKKAVQMQRVLRARLEEFTELQRVFFKGYDVKAVGGVYKWKGHKDEEEIEDKITTLLDESVSVVPLKFLSEDSFYKAFEGLGLDELTTLSNYLIK